jgi:8-oxo-dGTP pyrophosphatase MutT (NUDIX family)
MGRRPIPTWFFALAVVRRGHRFLLTQERKYGSTWSIPGGRVEPGEDLAAAALREVLEETGRAATV